MLMQGLTDAPGEFRTEQVELKLYRKKISVAPDAKMVLPLMDNLFSYVKTSRDLLLIVTNCVYYNMLMNSDQISNRKQAYALHMTILDNLRDLTGEQCSRDQLHSLACLPLVAGRPSCVAPICEGKAARYLRRV